MREGGKPAFSARAQTAERPSNPRMQQPFVALSRRRRSLSISPSLTDWHGNTDVEGYMRESAAEEAAVSPFFSWWISIRLLSSGFLPSFLPHSVTHSTVHDNNPSVLSHPRSPLNCSTTRARPLPTLGFSWFGPAIRCAAGATARARARGTW